MTSESHKYCTCCGNVFYKPENVSSSNWNARKTCSQLCASKMRKRPTPLEPSSMIGVAAEALSRVMTNWRTPA